MTTNNERSRAEFEALPYSTPLELFHAFKRGEKFVLHYHGKTYDVTRMEPREKVVYVSPPGFPVKVFPDGKSAEGDSGTIWLARHPASPASASPEPASTENRPVAQADAGTHQIITLCGSARFENLFKAWNEALTMAGHTVFGLTVYPSDKAGVKHWYSDEQKLALDAAHFRKIEASDAIFVINRDAYIGHSTMNEIEHARKHGKTIYFLESWGKGNGVFGAPPSPIDTTTRSGAVCPWSSRLLGPAGPVRSAIVELVKAPQALAASAQATQAVEPVAWQYRWTNPAGNPNVSAEALAWKECVPRGSEGITMRIRELETYRYDGKVCYEVRALYTHPAPATAQEAEPASTAVQSASASASTEGAASAEDVISKAVDRFLGWPLPKTFAPDCGVSFTPLRHGADSPFPDLAGKILSWPTGANLLTADEARAMFEHCLAALAPTGKRPASPGIAADGETGGDGSQGTAK